MNDYQTWLLVALLLCAVPGCLFWFRAKYLLRERGYPVALFQQGKHMQDLFYMKEMIHCTRNPEEQAKLRRLRTCMFSFLVLSIVLATTFVVAMLIPLLDQGS